MSREKVREDKRETFMYGWWRWCNLKKKKKQCAMQCCFAVANHDNDNMVVTTSREWKREREAHTTTQQVLFLHVRWWWLWCGVVGTIHFLFKQHTTQHNNNICAWKGENDTSLNQQESASPCSFLVQL